MAVGWWVLKPCAQRLRFTSVLLGRLLADRGASPGQVGLLLAALVAGSAVSSLVVGRFADPLAAAAPMRRSTWDCGRRCRRGPRGAGVVDRARGTDWHVVNGCRGQWSGHHVGAGDARHGKGRPVRCARHGGLQLHRIHRRCPWSPRPGGVGLLSHGSPSAAAFLVLVPLGLGGAALALFLSPRVEPAAVDDPNDSHRRAGCPDWDPHGGACSGSPGCSRSMLAVAGW